LKYSGKFFNEIEPGAEDAAGVVVPLLTQWFSPESVLDLGCGSGAWLDAFTRDGVADIYGVDGLEPEVLGLKIPASSYSAVDLSGEWSLSRRFDLALCLEVAEHLPVAAGPLLVDELVRSAPVVVFSAAIPFQGGTHHLNERWQHEWAEEFARHDYRACDCIRPALWADTSVPWWYAQNCIAYVDARVQEELPSDLAGRVVSDLELLSVVHPRHLQIRANPRQLARKDAMMTLLRSVSPPS
jgi:hypothetical protein